MLDIRTPMPSREQQTLPSRHLYTPLAMMEGQDVLRCHEGDQRVRPLINQYFVIFQIYNITTSKGLCVGLS